ncbi:variant leucine-rich repeat-containing protein [Gordonia sp. NPDC003422]
MINDVVAPVLPYLGVAAFVLVGVLRIVSRAGRSRRGFAALKTNQPYIPSGAMPPAHPIDVQVASDPRTLPQTLAQMVTYAPALRPFVAANPATDPALLHYLGSLGDPEVDRALATRGLGPSAREPDARWQFVLIGVGAAAIAILVSLLIALVVVVF